MDESTSELFRRADAVFDAALDLPAAEREAYADSACGDDARLRAAVRELLSAYARSGEFLDAPAAELAAPFLAGIELPLDPEIPMPARVGQFRVLSEIGHGGMGTVYLAERDDGQFQHRVALKLVRGGLGSPFLVRRFLQERQILASLQHPNVARLLDGGVTTDGVPYFAMEYVDGEPIHRYCEARALSLDVRLGLFRDVCGAVAYAHGSRVVHRDLKPTNILVTPAGEVKLLDFGVAKLIADEAAGPAAPVTRTGLRALTPEYAAPEQLLGEPVTPATDVYALGMLLYELLVGARPYRLQGHTAAEVERVVCETVPRRPSDAARRATGRSGDRQWRRLRGELDTLVMKALEKDPARRYSSAAALLEDLDRFAAGRPLLARPAGRLYRARRYLARHRRPMLATAGAAAVLAAALFLGQPTAPQPAADTTPLPPDRILVADLASTLDDPVLVRALGEAVRIDLAQYPRVRVLSPQQVAVGLQHMGRAGELAVNDSLALELAVREGIKAVVTGEVERLAGTYVISARLVATADGEMLTAARETADSVGLMDAVGRLTQRLRRDLGETMQALQASPPLPRVTTSSLPALRAYSEGMRLNSEVGDRAAAARQLERAIELDPTFASAWRILGGIHESNADAGRAAHAMERALAHSERLPLRERYMTQGSYHLNVTRDFPKAIAVYRAQLERDPGDRAALNNLALVYDRLHDYAEQERTLRRLLAADTTIVWTLTGLSEAVAHQGRFDQAGSILDEQERRFPDYPATSMVRAYVAAAQQRWPEAERHIRERLAGSIARGDVHDVLDAHFTLGQILLVQGRLGEAEAELRRGVELSQDQNVPGRVLTGSVQLAWLELRYRDRPQRALAVVDSVLRRFPLESIHSADRPYPELSDLYAALGEGDRIRALLALIEQDPDAAVDRAKAPGNALRGHVALLDGRHADAARAFTAAQTDMYCRICMLPALAETYERSGDIARAVATYERYLNTPWKWRFEPDAPHLATALERLAALYDRQNRAREAAQARGRLERLRQNADPKLRIRTTQARG